MTNYDKVKIILLGDSGVGKTSVVSMMVHGVPLSNPSWTVGASLEVKLHDYLAGTPQQKTYFIDLWDIGGSSSHANSRPVFYNSVNGIILVHDLTNRKSEGNLHRWLLEILNKGKSISDDETLDPEQFVGSSNTLPILIIGTKLDGIEGRRLPASRSSSISETCRADEIYVNCMDPKSFAAGSTCAVKLSRFFDTVIEKRFNRDISTSHLGDRKRLYNSSNLNIGKNQEQSFANIQIMR